MTWVEIQDPARVERALETARQHGFRSRGGREMLDYAYGDEKFALWLLLADQRCLKRAGVGLFDVADWTYRDAYNDGVSPAEAVDEALAADGFPGLGGY